MWRKENGMDIEFTRGDTQFLRFRLKDLEGELVELQADDRLYFTVKQSQHSKKVLDRKSVV